MGSHLVSRLEASGHTVLRGDREGNISEPVDIIIDTASYGNLWGQNDVKEIYKANVERVKKLLNNSSKYKKVILTSTSSVNLPVQTPYSESKKRMEEIGQEYKATIIRPYTIYGIGDYKDHLIPKIFRSCLVKEPMNLAMAPVHDYVWVEDLVDLYISEPEGIIEFGTGVPAYNSSVVLLIEQITQGLAFIEKFEEARPYDAVNWFAEKQHNLATTMLMEGLVQIYADYKQRSQTAYS